MFGRPLTFPSDACEFAPIARAAQATNAAATLLIAESSALSRSNGIPLGVELRHPFPGSGTACPRRRRGDAPLGSKALLGIGLARRAREMLEADGLEVDYQESAAEHHVDPADVPAAVAWLERTIVPMTAGNG